MNSSTTTWGAGDYPAMAMRLEPAAQAAVDAAAIAPGERVLDLATGTGNAALLAAHRGAHVIGVDAEPALLQLAARRARGAGLEVQWLLGDLQAVPVPAATADVVLSVFGVMYATDHAAAAGELTRITASAGRVVFASWLPGSVMPAMGQALAAYLPPPPPSSGPPGRWGDRTALSALLENSGLRVTAADTHELVLDFPDAPAATDFLIRTAGHVIIEQQRLITEGRWEDLRRDLLAFVERRAEPAGDQVRLTLEYLLATARSTTTAR